MIEIAIAFVLLGTMPSPTPTPEPIAIPLLEPTPMPTPIAVPITIEAAPGPCETTSPMQAADSTLAEAAQQANDMWAGWLGCQPFTISCCTSATEAADGVNVIVWGDPSIYHPYAVGVRLKWWTGDQDIVVDPDLAACNLLTVITHELGHVLLGPDHDANFAIMEPVLTPC